VTWCQSGVIARIRVPSDVSHPDIKAGICQDVCQTLVTEVGKPVGGGSKKPMLKEDNWMRNVACMEGRGWRERRGRERREGEEGGRDGWREGGGGREGRREGGREQV